jgi:hypothetical protein
MSRPWRIYRIGPPDTIYMITDGRVPSEQSWRLVGHIGDTLEALREMLPDPQQPYEDIRRTGTASMDGKHVASGWKPSLAV